MLSRPDPRNLALLKIRLTGTDRLGNRFVLTGRRGWKKALPGFQEKAVFLSKEL